MRCGSHCLIFCLMLMIGVSLVVSVIKRAQGSPLPAGEPDLGDAGSSELSLAALGRDAFARNVTRHRIFAQAIHEARNDPPRGGGSNGSNMARDLRTGFENVDHLATRDRANSTATHPDGAVINCKKDFCRPKKNPNPSIPHCGDYSRNCSKSDAMLREAAQVQQIQIELHH